MTTDIHIPSKVLGWYRQHIKPEALDQKVEATLDYIRRIEDGDEGYTVWAHELVSGKHGVYTTRIFLDDILCHGIEVYMAMDAEDEDNQDIIMAQYSATSKELARVFRQFSKLPGEFYVGSNEADGSLGIFYEVSA